MAITLDAREWHEAVRQYAAACDKTFLASLDHFAMNLAIKCMQVSQVANRATIQAVRDRMPPKLISWLARRRFGTSPRVARMYRTGAVHVAKSGRKTYRQSKIRTRGSMVSYTREEAKHLAKTHFGRRLSSVGFLRTFFKLWIDTMRTARSEVGRGSYLAGTTNGSHTGVTGSWTNPKGSGFTTHYSATGTGKRSSDVMVAFDFRSTLIRSPESHVAGAERKLQATIDAMVPVAVADMKQHAERKLEQAARRYSAL